MKTVVELLVAVAEKSGLPGQSKKAMVKAAVREMYPRLADRFGLPKAMGEPEVLDWLESTVDSVVDGFNRHGWPGR